MKRKAIAVAIVTALFTMGTCAAAENLNGAEQSGTYSYYEECPQLPIPSSCLDLQQGFSMRSSINGVTSSSYGYSVSYGSNLEIADAGQAYLDILKEEGLEVKETSESAYEVYDGEEKLADISIDAQLSVTIGQGDTESGGNYFPFFGGEAEQKPVSEVQNITLGDSISLDFVTMTLDEVVTVDEICPEDKSGENYYYLEDVQGEKYLCLKGTIKNTGVRSISSRAIDARLAIDDQYTNRYGHILFSTDPKEVVGYELQPQEEGTFCLYFEVSDETLFFMEEANIRFGFNENFQSGYGRADYIYELPFTLHEISGRSM